MNKLISINIVSQNKLILFCILHKCNKGHIYITFFIHAADYYYRTLLGLCRLLC